MPDPDVADEVLEADFELLAPPPQPAAVMTRAVSTTAAAAVSRVALTRSRNPSR